MEKKELIIDDSVKKALTDLQVEGYGESIIEIIACISKCIIRAVVAEEADNEESLSMLRDLSFIDDFIRKLSKNELRECY